MAKIRVHELAKELGMENKVLMDVLKKKEVDVKSHMSTLEDDVVASIRGAYGKKHPAANQETKAEEKQEAPKKKNIVQVFRPQNLKNGSRQGGRPNGQRAQRPGQNQQGQRPTGNQGQNQGQRPAANQGSQNQGQRPAANQGSQNQGQRQTANQNQNQGGQNQQGQRPASGQRNSRPFNNNNNGNRNGQGGGHNDRRPNGDNRNNRFQGNQGGRSDDRRDNRRDNRDNRDNRNRDNRRRDERSSIPAPVVPEQKPSRNKTKDKEKDHKKQERLDDDFVGKSRKGKNQKNQAEIKKPQKQEKKKEETIKQIVIPESLTIQELADKMKVVPSVIVKKLFMQGKMVTVNQEVDYDTAEEIAMEFDVLCEKEEVVDVIEELLKEDEEDESKMVKRPPVVCVMGHVDHGKTSLLDAIRDTNVTDREAGGITQHIGASVVTVNGEKITFLDTPGHEAFTSMRMRGANSTDIAILVVAADDGVMPQTIEAINHAKVAEIPIIVAVNKIDLPGANIDRIKQQLMEYELVPEEWGGDTIFVPISAKKHLNIENLLEMVLLVADMKELKANPNKQAKGAVIEARLDKAKGPIASMLVQRGTLNIGDTIVVGKSIGKIRAMKNDKGQKVKAAGPSTPVEIMGLTDVPEAGDTFYEVKDEKTAKHLIERRKRQEREEHLNNVNKVTLSNVFEKMASENLKQLNIIVKADVQGTSEALKQSLEKLSNDEVKVKVIHYSAGAVTESDVQLAKAAKAIIIAFNVRPTSTAKEMGEREEVEVKQYSVIYQAIEDVEAAMKGMLDPVFEEKVIGEAEVRQTFRVSSVGTIAGCFVLNGKVERNAGVRVIREDVVIHEGKLVSLKRFKDDVKEVTKGFECGLQIENYNDLKEGDKIEVFIQEQVKQV